MGASEREEFLRAAWEAMVAREIATRGAWCSWTYRRGANTSLAPLLYVVWAPKGERARCLRSPEQPWQEHDAAAGEHVGGGDGHYFPRGGRGHEHSEVFEASYVERVLAPELKLKEGQVVVMDNLAAPKGERVGELIEGRSCELLYLPPYYSPGLNPIDVEAFSKMKALLRKVGARTREALVETMGAALSAVTARDAPRGFFGHCGYRLLGQLL